MTDFGVHGWDGAQWVTLESVTGNNLVKRNVSFSPFTTNKIQVTNANSVSRITEVEAFGW